ncbi:MAG: hypothetical protein LCI00_33890 [Chloroflexi bacterium]|nr:hypothetical protein [Chloroflexota bacterium]MCC6894337.1 hypothetical protein [Anaerolineae bacterium]
MYGSVDFQLAEFIIHTIGRKQAEDEAQQEDQPIPNPSLLARLIRRLTARPAYDHEVSRMQENDPSLVCE